MSGSRLAVPLLECDRHALRSKHRRVRTPHHILLEFGHQSKGADPRAQELGLKLTMKIRPLVKKTVGSRDSSGTALPTEDIGGDTFEEILQTMWERYSRHVKNRAVLTEGVWSVETATYSKWYKVMQLRFNKHPVFRERQTDIVLSNSVAVDASLFLGHRACGIEMTLDFPAAVGKYLGHGETLTTAKSAHHERQKILRTRLTVVTLKCPLHVPKDVLDGIEEGTLRRKEDHNHTNGAKKVDDIWVAMNGSSIEYPDRVRSWILADASAARVHECPTALKELEPIECSVSVVDVEHALCPEKREDRNPWLALKSPGKTQGATGDESE